MQVCVYYNSLHNCFVLQFLLLLFLLLRGSTINNKTQKEQAEKHSILGGMALQPIDGFQIPIKRPTLEGKYMIRRQLYSETFTL